MCGYACKPGSGSHKISKSDAEVTLNQYWLLSNTQVLSRLVAQRRLCLEVFTSHALARPDAHERWVYPSELCLYNNAAHGFWTSVEARVLDLTEFRTLHPAGPTITETYCGVDATRAYCDIGHRKSPEVHSLLGLYQIGRLKWIELPRGVGTGGFDQETVRVWVKHLYTVTEVEVLVATAFTIQDKVRHSCLRLCLRLSCISVHPRHERPIARQPYVVGCTRLSYRFALVRAYQLESTSPIRAWRQNLSNGCFNLLILFERSSSSRFFDEV